MIALIKREIKDNLAFFIIAIVAATWITIAISAEGIYRNLIPIGIPDNMYGFFMFSLIFMSLVFAAMGVVQISGDKDKKVSAFLFTLAVRREHIISAKMLTGLICILTLFVPIILTDIFIFNIFGVGVLIDFSFFVKIICVSFLMNLACYVLGLRLGWLESKAGRISGILFLVPILGLLILAKGFGVDTIVLFSLIIAALAVGVWQKFMSASF